MKPGSKLRAEHLSKKNGKEGVLIPQKKKIFFKLLNGFWWLGHHHQLDKMRGSTLSWNSKF